MAKANKGNSKANSKTDTKDALKDWADKLAASDPVQKVRLLVRPGRFADWSIVKGGTIYMPDIDGNALTGEQLEGQAASFQQLAEQHFAKLNTNDGVPCRRADYKLEAIALDKDGKEFVAWETLPLVLNRGAQSPTLESAEAERTAAGTNFFDGMARTSVWERDQLIRQVGQTLTSRVKAANEAVDIFIEAGRLRADAKDIDAKKEIELARIEAERQKVMYRTRAFTTSLRESMPLLNRVIDLSFTLLGHEPPPSQQANDAPASHAEHAQYVHDNFEQVAPILAQFGVQQAHINLIASALEQAANGNPEPLTMIVSNNPLSQQQVALLHAAVLASTRDRQLADSLRELLLTAEVC